MTDRGLLRPILYSRTLSYVALLSLLVGAYAALPIWKEKSAFHDAGDIPSEIHAALTLVLGWLLVFRTNVAYNRWWEARTLWGSLVNACRNLAAKVAVLVDLPPEELAGATCDIVAFPFALRDHLRDEAVLNQLPGFENQTETVDHIPGFLVTRRYAALGRWKQRGWIDGNELRVIDRDLARLLDICGGCERIRRTRVPRSYRMFAHQCVLLFLITFPWGIVNDFMWWTIPLTVITAYFMLGLDIVAVHVEEPFGRDEDDLDLDSLCQTISRTVNEIVAKACDVGGRNS